MLKKSMILGTLFFGSSILAQVNVGSIPQKFSPSTQEIGFSTAGVKTLTVSLPGVSSSNTFLKYLKKGDASQGKVSYTTAYYENTTSINGIRLSSSSDSQLNLNMGGNYSYECNIKTKNKKVTSVQGACIVQVVIELVAGTKLEIFSGAQLISKRFFPMDDKEFMDQFSDAHTYSDQLKVLENLLNSYKSTKTKFEITASDLGEILEEVTFSNDKMDVIKRLHKYVIDRENLKDVIDDIFMSPFDQRDAYKIVGIK